ncbi:MAG: hypothetical protein HDR72_00160 [Ruminococcaceae bacterium]|nr:hypothetical protein [Oscillospiraceae bacterium]
MMKLLPFELGKIWRKKSFPALMLLLLILNVFLLWYLNDPKDDQPPLSAYKAIAADLAEKAPEEREAYIDELRETMQGIRIVDYIVLLRSHSNAQSDEYAERMFENNRGTFDKYKPVYDSGEYLRYTDSYYKESALISEIAEEYEKVAAYDEYIASIEENKNRLSGISIFVKEETEGFSSRNIEKSYEDHKRLNSSNIRFVPSKGVRMASENTITDLFILLSIMLFVGGLITEEKEKGLFYVTRATRNGIAKCMGAKLAALLIQCLAIVLLLYGSNFVYAAATTGIGDLSASIHSVSAFQESSIEIPLFGYFLLVYLTKVVVVFTFGAAVAAVSIISPRSFVPQLAAVGWLALNWLAFAFIPAYSIFNPLKYLSFWGIVNPKYLYGEYLNFNIAEYPVNRTAAAAIVIAVLFAAVVAPVFWLFAKGGSLGIRKTRRASVVPFRPHGSLLLHEGSKILLMGKAAVVLAVFALLICRGDLGKERSISVGEQYYKLMITELEGELTDEKETFIINERARYEEAFAQIAAVDEMVAAGGIDRFAGETMKSRWYAVTALYPYFQRVEAQYEHILGHGGVFIYDTGYQYLFGKIDDNYTVDLLLLSMCMIFALGSVLPMEEQTKSWDLLSATAKGRRSIMSRKLAVCAVCAAVMGALPFVCRVITTARSYPLAMWGSAANCLPMYYESGIGLPIWAFAAAAAILQIVSVFIVTAVVLLISANRKSFIQTVFLGLLILAVPLTLSVMGLKPAKWVSVYPLYALTKLI